MKKVEVIYRGHRASIAISLPIGAARKSEMKGTITFVKGASILLSEADATKLLSLDSNFALAETKQEASKAKQTEEIKAPVEATKTVVVEKVAVEKVATAVEKKPVATKTAKRPPTRKKVATGPAKSEDDFLKRIGAAESNGAI